MKSKMCTKGELACAYLPNIEPHSAVNRLMIWVKRNTQLMEALKKTGYHTTQKYLSPRQAELIKEYLGEP